MKKPDVALREWVEDEIRFDTNRGPRTIFSRDYMVAMATAIRTNEQRHVVGCVLPRADLVLETEVEFIQANQIVDWSIVTWLHRMPKPRLELITGQWLASFESLNEAVEWLESDIRRRASHPIITR
jgi:hypothetical protein